MKQTVTFKIARDAEAKAAKEFHDISMEVSFEGVDEDTIMKHAIANMKVHWQAQIRNNWDKFLENGVPETIVFGEPLYEGTGRGKMTPEKALAVLKAAGLTAEQLREMLGQ